MEKRRLTLTCNQTTIALIMLQPRMAAPDGFTLELLTVAHGGVDRELSYINVSQSVYAGFARTMLANYWLATNFVLKLFRNHLAAPG